MERAKRATTNGWLLLHAMLGQTEQEPDAAKVASSKGSGKLPELRIVHCRIASVAPGGRCIFAKNAL
jgi:hypothetical protein